ncbi:MAG TPA: ABC transporter ATP-binding protein [Oceanobacillus sp.]|nr:ABC transporter ATP-binding protein [Oceanobacillus sp.]
MSIQLERVNKSYGVQPVVRDFSLEIETGELFVLLGASGSGKSTLLRMIAGLTEVDSGRILLNDQDVTHLPPQKRGTGFVFQNYSLFRHMTVAQNIGFGLSIRRTRRQVHVQRVQELLELIGLPDYGDRYPSQLSGGQQQRVALARALAYQPSVLLLDEPFGALDVKIRVQLRQNLREIHKRLGLTAILVTHDQEEAFDIADRIGIIEQGELLEVGTPSELYRRPQNLFTATFLGSTNILRARRNGKSVYVGDVSIPAPPETDHLTGQPVEVLFRPEEVELSTVRPAAQTSVIGSGTVENIAFAGPILRLSVRLASGETIQALLTPGEFRERGIEPGQEVWVSLKDYHLLPTNTAAEKTPVAVTETN